MHNFMRYLEDWGWRDVPSHYEGSLVSLFIRSTRLGSSNAALRYITHPTDNYAFDHTVPGSSEPASGHADVQGREQPDLSAGLYTSLNFHEH